jgi:hypothetical protein
MSNGKSAQLSPVKKLIGIVVLLAVMAGGISVGLMARGGPAPAASPDPVVHILLMAGGIVFAVLGAALYGVVLVTSCFTFNFQKPFLKSYGPKLWVLNVVVGLLLQAAVAFMMAPVLFEILFRHLPAQVALLTAFLAPFVVANLVMVWLSIWTPLEWILIKRRLAARGIPREHLATGMCMGLSDPSKSSFKKFTLVEEDMGMLWINPDMLRYRGDSIDFDIRRDQLLEIERRADAGSTSSYFGAAHVIIRFAQDDATEQRQRLHTEGNWTQTGKAKALNDLAERLSTWKSSPAQLGAAR